MNGSRLKCAVLGFPRIGVNRELKKATEDFWKGKISEGALNAAAKQIRETNWRLQKNAGIDLIPSNDFSFYDHMLDMTVLLGAIPPRFQKKAGGLGGFPGLNDYSAMARGKTAVPAMEMTKWFDTNYHYLVPEFEKDQTFKISSEKPFEEFAEAKALGILTRPVLVGPVTYLLLGNTRGKLNYRNYR